MSRNIVIIGAGGHAKVVAEAIRLQGKYTIAGFLDDGVAKGKPVFDDVPCLGAAGEMPEGLQAFVVAIGNNKVRKQFFERYSAALEPAVVIHPSASVSRYASVGKGAVVLAGAVIAYGARVGENCIVNALALVDHETEVGMHAHIAQGTIIGSNCVIPSLYCSQPGETVNSYSKLT
jgi:sugar O-acyltransferase (sialic acid O-acetyltransferase NeuD family)